MREIQYISRIPPRCVTTFFAGKLQGLTSKSKVHCRNQNVSHTPNKNHWTPHSCDEEKQWRLQSQHNFLPFFQKKRPTCRFCPFAAHRLRRDLQWYYCLTLFFSPSDSNNLMSSKCPPRKSIDGEACFAVECKGVIRGILWTKIALLTLDVSD